MPDTLTSPLVDVETRAERVFDLSGAEMRQGDDGRLEFHGEAAVFGQRSVDLGGFTEEIARGSFRKVLATDPDVRFLINHDPNRLCARTKSGTMTLSETVTGLGVRADLAPTSYAKDLQVLVKRGDLDQMSFGFRVGKGNDTWEERSGTVHRTINNFEALLDVSSVTFPGYTGTSASMRSLNGVTFITEDGTVAEDELRNVAWRVHQGELQITDEQRWQLDEAFAKIGKVSPWTAERARRQLDCDEELRQLLNGETHVPTFRLAARRRRLRLIAPESRDAVTSTVAMGAPDVTAANDALSLIQAGVERIEDWLEKAGYPDPDDPPADDSATPIEPAIAFKAIQTEIEKIEDTLEQVGFPDPDEPQTP